MPTMTLMPTTLLPTMTLMPTSPSAPPIPRIVTAYSGRSLPLAGSPTAG